MKPVPKRQPTKILAVYIDTTADNIRRILMWTFNPISLDFDNTKVWNSGDLIADNLSVKTTMEKLTFHIRSINETGSIDTLPSLLIWDRFQLNILSTHIPALSSLVRKDGLVILQERCYEIYKYDLRVQGFGLQDIANVMGIPNKDSYAQFCKIALYTEQAFKNLAKTLTKNGKNTTKTAQESDTATNRDTS